MLSDICGELKNWFVTDDSHKHFDTFTIKDSVISPSDFIQPNQYFRIVGSVFNDGVYKNDDNLVLNDETFEGAIWLMSVPNDILALDREVTEWIEKYSSVMYSPYSSESFGGYSYSKTSTTNLSGSTWQAVFSARLNKWRKI